MACLTMVKFFRACRFPTAAAAATAVLCATVRFILRLFVPLHINEDKHTIRKQHAKAFHWLPFPVMVGRSYEVMIPIPQQKV